MEYEQKAFLNITRRASFNKKKHQIELGYKNGFLTKQEKEEKIARLFQKLNDELDMISRL